MKQDFIRAKELAGQWDITPRRVNQLCADGMIPGAYKAGRFWMIPSDVERPAMLREKSSYGVRAAASRRLPCPVGITSYREVSGECYYVDKTLLIRDIIDDHSKVYLFTRPRRFGKTLMMDMLRTYFERCDEDTSVYFADKQIWACGRSYRKLQGRYPVIFLSFKDAHQTNWEDMYKSLCFTLREEYIRHVDILMNERLNDYDRRYFTDITNGQGEITDYQFALGKLSSMLAACYGSKTIIIIDEYDTPIQQGYLHHYYDEVVGFMRNLFSSSLKDNDDLELGILTGILRIAKESLFSGLNNLVVNTTVDDRYSEYFGFTGAEVEAMADYYGVPEKLSEIKDWYDGYSFGGVEIYNPWSVINYFNNNCKPKAFWSRTSGNEIIGQLVKGAGQELYQSLTRLLQGQEVQSIIDTDIIYPEVDSDPDMIFSFLLVAGYLRIKDVISEFNDNPICSLEIPNREVKGAFQKEILGSYRELFTGSILRDFELAFRTEDTMLFTDTLQKYLLQSAGTFDTAHENFYHGTVFGMLAILSDRYYILSNRESGEGRFDLQLEPRDHKRKGYIIEFKVAKSQTEQELAGAAKDAVRQIRDRGYAEDMKYHGITEIGFFGIAFHGKRVACEYQEN